MSKTINVSTRTFIRFWLVILGFVAAGFLLVKAKTGLIVLGAALFIAIAIRPFVEKMQSILERRFPKIKASYEKAAVISFAIMVLAISLVVAVIGPVVISETGKFVQQAPEMFNETLGGWDGINEFGRSIGIGDLQKEIVKAVSDFSANFGNILVSGLGSAVGVFSGGFLALVLTLLTLLEGPKLLNRLWKTMNGKKKDESVEEARRVTSRMGRVISAFVSKQLTIALLDGTATALIVFVLSLVFGFSTSLAIPMGLITMVFYLIPMFGQIIGCALVTLLLIFSSPIAGLVFFTIYIIYAQVENNWIAPKMQGEAMKLSPLIILASITLGTYLFGLVGAIISIPVAGCIKVLSEEYPRIKEIQEKND